MASSIQQEREQAEQGLAGLALGSRDVEVHDGQVRRNLEQESDAGGLGGFGGAPGVKTSYDVEEPEPEAGAEPEREPGRHSSSSPAALLEKVRAVKLPGEQEGETVETEHAKRDKGDVKTEYTVEEDAQQQQQETHPSTLQKVKAKVGEAEDKLKLRGEKNLEDDPHPELTYDSRESRPGILARLKHKLSKSGSGSGGGKNSDGRALKPEEVAAETRDAASLESWKRSEEEKLAGSGERREALLPQEVSSEVGTGYEEESEEMQRGESGQEQEQQQQQPDHQAPKWSAYTEDMGPRHSDEGGLAAAPVAQDRLPGEQDVPPLEEVKAPGLLDRVKEETAAVGESIQEKLNLKSSDDTLVDSSRYGEQSGFLGRIAKKIGLSGSDAGHGRSQSS